MAGKPTVLIVDDDSAVRDCIGMVVKDECAPLYAGTGARAIELFNEHSVDVVLLDIMLPDMDGKELIGRFKEFEPNTEIIMLTAVGEIASAVQSVKMGAYEYISKPFEIDHVLSLVDKALEKRRFQKEVCYLKSELERCRPFEKMVGEDPKMKEMFDLISNISDGSGAVLIQGESGTGKELVARALHNLGPRKDMPFVVVNCSAIPPNLMESHIFGHNKGAFTGAGTTVMGKLEIADTGTVFLDDVDMLASNLQAKLLRVIQEKEFERVGSTKGMRLDVRFVAASNRNIRKLISKGEFREDLYYRLNVFPVDVPPLRERKEDIPLLLEHFLERYSKKTTEPRKRFAKKAVDALKAYHWPGNVRELENFVERQCTVGTRKVIRVRDVFSSPFGLERFDAKKLKDAVAAYEKKYIRKVLERVNWNRNQAAKILGVHRNTLADKINALNLENN